MNKGKQLRFALCVILFLSFALADEAARPVTIRVYSIPGGASFWIDGNDTNQRTPCMVNLEFDYYSNNSIIPKMYRLLKAGYEPYEGFIRGPQDTTIDAALQPLKS